MMNFTPKLLPIDKNTSKCQPYYYYILLVKNCLVFSLLYKTSTFLNFHFYRMKQSIKNHKDFIHLTDNFPILLDNILNLCYSFLKLHIFYYIDSYMQKSKLYMEVFMDWEFTFLDFIATHFRSDIGNFIFPFLSSLGNSGLIWIFFSFLLLSNKQTRKIGITALLSLMLMLIIGNFGLKPLIARERPFVARPEKLIYMLISPPGEYSFPSGHSFAAFAAASTYFIGNKRIGIPALILATLIAFSRLYLYVHFPTDVIGGMILGILIAIFSWNLTGKYFHQNNHS